MTHTPGPWRAVTRLKCAVVTSDTAGCNVYQNIPIGDEPIETIRRWQDDARLIAAAPELLEALKWALGSVNCEPHEWTLEEDADMHLAALAAIAKAEGRDAAHE